MAHWVSIIGFANGEHVEDTVLNRPVGQLRERTDYLYARIQELLGSGVFESVRVLDVALTIGTTVEPDVGDVVYLDPATRTYSKALATVDMASNVFQTAQITAYGLGILVAKAGETGTVVLYGKTLLGPTAAWDLDTLLEANETFRPGPYYLSSFEAGKLTANPSGIAIYMGYFVDSADSARHGGYAIINPTYKDVGEAHLHRAFALASQPAGTQLLTGAEPDQTHAIVGYTPVSAAYGSHGTHSGADSAVKLEDTIAGWTLGNFKGLTVRNVTAIAESRAGVNESVILDNDTDEITTVTPMLWNTGDEYYIEARCRIVLFGTYAASEEVTYTLTLTDATGVVAPGAGGPENGARGFDTVYLKWVSSDPEEGEGLSRVVSYEMPVSIGTKGVKVVVENALDGAALPYWDWCEAANEDIGRRQWTLSVPSQTRGWLARRYRQFCANHQAIDYKYSLLLFGGPYTNPTGRTTDNLRVVATKLYGVAYTGNPADGDTVTIGDVVFEFDEDGSVSTGHVPVVVNVGGAADTYVGLRDAILEYGIADVHAVIDTTNTRLLLGVSVATTVTASLSSATLSVLSAGATSDFEGASKPTFLVYGDDYEALVTTTGFWSAAEFFAPVALTNGLQIMFIPRDEDGTAMTASTVAGGDYWDTQIDDEAPGARFVYNIGMDGALRQFYPPMPMSAAALVINGLEQLSKALHPDAAAYQVAYGGLYWLVDRYAQVPWPADWVSYTDPGTMDLRTSLYLVHMRMQNTSVVTSLQPAPGSPIKVLRCGTGDTATTGDLMLAVDFAFAEEDTDLADYRVLKKISGTKFIRGPVVSKIRQGAGISITSPPGVPEGCGEVMIALSAAQDFAGDFDDIALQNAKQELIGMFPYIRLLGWTTGASNIDSGFVAKFQVPYTVSGSYQVLLYLTVFGESNIAAGAGVKRAGLQFTYSMLRDYDPALETYGTLVDNLIEPMAAANLEIPFGKAAGIDYGGTTLVYKAYDPMIIHNNPNDTYNDPARIVRALGQPLPQAPAKKGSNTETVLDNLLARPGTLVAVRISRAGVATASEEYTGSLGFMQLRWRLVRVGS